MSEIPIRPRLRPLDYRVGMHQGEQIVVFRDPLRMSPVSERFGLSLAAFAIAQLFDGARTIGDVQTEIARVFGGAIVAAEQIESIAKALDDGLFLEGERVDAALAAWRTGPVREPACAGGSYPADASELRAFLDAQLTRDGGPDRSTERNGKSMSIGAPVRAVISPHIDFHRGGHAYAWAWSAVEAACDAELFVIFGTAHAGTARARFALTKKSYATPLGTVPTDVELVERVVANYRGADDLFEGEIAHKAEHSIEFQIVELAHLFHGKRAIRVLPVLCGSIHDLIGGGARPSEDARLRAFHDALAAALSGVAEEKVAFVAGIDLAHVGRDFDDPPLDAAGVERIMRLDRDTLSAIVDAQDGDAVHADIAKDVEDERKICGHAPLVATLEAVRRRRDGKKLAGELLCHDRWYDGASTVSFASVVLRADGARA